MVESINNQEKQTFISQNIKLIFNTSDKTIFFLNFELNFKK